MSESYKKAGVNIEAGYEAVSRMKKHVQKTMRKEVLGGLGSFGGLFDLSSFQYKEPVLVSGTDGVGTKLMLAFMMDKHDTIGIDAVAMCVNDIVVQGAEPIFFLDYIACGKAEPEKIEQIVKGVSEGCVQAGCALIGGETAEMPGMYGDEEYDLAGFSVGVAEKSNLLTGEKVQDGDVLIGLASNGIHSNGYSLVRYVLLEENKLDLHETYEGFDQSLGEVLLTPTRIYVKALLEAMKKHTIHGLAHITGGGFYENIPRMLPEGFGAEVEKGTWNVPHIFRFIQEKGNIPEDELYNVFNMGIGMICAVPKEEVEPLMNLFHELGETPAVIGKVVKGEGIKMVGANE
ncbi:phosphoribosylformylglycinamidine cyclo-ligase [Massilibacterium senegalense]|uniref:phosphoribosylformylglycinamidine cyclo-ligase n=1 Tax=Massilibacterium senegalense TaxID=1632858 RepID=UPI0007837FE2|nr:phosphoribosylformylglycinamidine cyclo-ligase [Massilibacterium senegalense]